MQRADGHSWEELPGPTEPRAPTAVAEPETDPHRKPDPRRTEPPPVPTLATKTVTGNYLHGSHDLGIFTALGFSDAGLRAAHYEFAQTSGQLTGQFIPVHAGTLALEQGWFSSIALRGPRPVCVTGKYSWTSFRQGPSGSLIAHKGEKTDWICDLRFAICDIF